ncbi:MAG: hypothetical protein AB7R89_08970 [Dehalococcoidia bacterium]
MATTTSLPAADRETAATYARLEERILTRDQVGAADAFYDLVRAERPLSEMLRETVRIHAPYTQIPYHQRLDDGVVKFVNNDHCLLSARASMRLVDLVPRDAGYLPLAQTIWYVPSGLDPWNQLIGKAPGHYTRLYKIEVGEQPPPPQMHWPDQEPLQIEGTVPERLNEWLTLVQRGDVLTSYRVFLGLLEDKANRRRLLAQLAFAGLIDVQDRMYYNRSYTTGHKSYRARATIELGEMAGWENAHSIVYAGVPDIAVGPRWYSTYEMSCNVVQLRLEGRDQELMRNDAPLTDEEQNGLIEAILHGLEPAWIDRLVALLEAGKGPRRILDVIQIAAAQVLLETGHPNNFSMSQHGSEYCNTLRWFYDTFDHPHQLKLLFVAASFINQASHHQQDTPGNGAVPIRPPRAAAGLSPQRLLERLDEALIALRPDESVALTSVYLQSGNDRAPLLTTLAMAACKFGNDPHNQELGLSLIEDYRHSTAADRDRLLLACAQHTAGHRKYGDPLEAYRRYAAAFGIDTRQSSRGDAPIEDAVLDD